MPILEEHLINIHWTKALKPINGLKVNKSNQIVIEPDILPIIFVPGIMGSKLRIKNSEDVPEDELGKYIQSKGRCVWL